jgi:hypothetical protein
MHSVLSGSRGHHAVVVVAAAMGWGGHHASGQAINSLENRKV